MTVEVNKQQVCEMLGVTTRTVDSYMARDEDPLPVHNRAKAGSRTGHVYCAAEVLKWAVRAKIRELGVTQDGKVFDFEAERARKTHHEANLAALSEREKLGELLPAETVLKVWCDRSSAFRNKMLSLPTRLAHQLTLMDNIAEIESFLRTACSEALEELTTGEKPSDYGIKQRAARAAETLDRSGEHSGEAPAVIDSKPVGRQTPKAKPRSKRRARTVED